MSNSLQPTRLLHPWNSPGQNSWVGSYSLFQEIFPTQRSNPGLQDCRWTFYHLSHHESPRYDKEIIITSATSVLEKGKALKHLNLWLIAENQLIMLLSCSINRRKKLVFCIKTIGSIFEGQSTNSLAVLFDIFGGRMSPSRKKVINMLNSYNMCSVINILSMYFNNSLIRAALFPPPSADTDN